MSRKEFKCINKSNKLTWHSFKCGKDENCPVNGAGGPVCTITHGGDPALWPGARSGQSWWGHASWCRPLRTQRWICLPSRSSTGCVGASPAPGPQESAGTNPPAEPAGRGRWPRGWRRCRERRGQKKGGRECHRRQRRTQRENVSLAHWFDTFFKVQSQ